jgi:hypothetical protein
MNLPIQAASLLGILEKQLHLLNELACELLACRAALVTMDLDAIYRQIAIQTELCDRLQQAERERKSAWIEACTATGLDGSAGDLRGLIARLEPEIGTRMREIVTKLALAEGELRHLNHAHTILINGSRRTLSLLGNVLASFAPTYGRPTGNADSTSPALIGLPL